VNNKPWLLVVIVAVCGAGLLSLVMLVFAGAFLPGRQALSLGNRVGLVEVTGTMVTAGPVVDEISRLSRDRTIKAIVVRLESPGGVVAAAQEIFDEIKEARLRGTPVVASMGGVAASGAYYVACAADSIVANPGTLTGSIGVIMTFPNTEELFRKIGLEMQVVKTGEFKDMGSMSRPMTPAERQLAGDLIGDVYDQFVSAVATERGLAIDDVKKIADGRVLTGRQAYNLGLVDRLGGFQEAVMLAGRLAGISGEPTVVKKRRHVASIWDILEDLMGTASSVASKVARDGVSIEYLLE
jgi:protease-4